MALPTYDRFIEPLLRFLATQPDGASARSAQEGAAGALGLDEEQRNEVVASGQPVFRNRAGWAHDRLKRAGLSASPKRGIWKLTEAGHGYVAAHPGPLPADEVERLARAYVDVVLKPDRMDGEEPTSLPPAADPRTVSPEERLEAALVELRQSVIASLLETLATVSPTFFETVVLDLLHRMGYGASRADLQRVGGSGDAGIDGIISLDRLGLEKVYVQAKRWQGSVGRPEVQAFYGALAGQRARRGVFITTSAFTAQAIEFAHSVEGIVLVDGVRLAGLMIDHEVGVSARTLKVAKLDSDYFDEAAG